jgi:hypothetical protein
MMFASGKMVNHKTSFLGAEEAPRNWKAVPREVNRQKRIDRPIYD